nr:retrotransposon protein, putative, Ty1-copia subclass [Tanacetum cinerariifolium]
MLMTTDLDIQKNLEHLGAYDMLKELKMLYAQQADQELLQTVRISRMQTGRRTVCKLLHSQNEEIYRQLGASRSCHDSKPFSTWANSSSKRSCTCSSCYKSRKNPEKKKKSHKATKGNQRKGKEKMGYATVPVPPFAPKPKNLPTPKMDNLAKDAICHQCGVVGHWRRNYPIYLAELMKKKKLSQGASTLGALSLYVGDGHRAAVEAIKEFHLCLPSGLVLILHNCHYAPSITRGIISVSRLYKDSFVNRFENDNSVSVSRNNLIYFNAIPRDNIYEIVLSSSNTNDSSMYTVINKRAKLNLDFALLWHSRLGHISKKCIKKLQHDGLLDSTDIKSFIKCVSCMSRKMTKKSYSHQVKRVKDLLGLIHTDSFWDYALESIARILNMVPTKKIDKTPYEVWHEQAPKLSYLKVWGCEALVKRDTLTKPDKLEPKSIKCIFVGYLKETMRNSFYYLPENKVFVAWNAEFLENSFIAQEASGSLEDFKIIQEEDTHPSIDTSLNHDENDQEIDKPQSDINLIRRFYMENSKRETIPMQEKLKLSKSQGVSTPVEIQCIQNIPYASAIGSIMYVVRCTRPDVAFAQNITSRFQQNPGELHWTTVKNILKYLRNTRDMFLVYRGDTKRELKVCCYTDAEYLTDADDLNS